jgi:uncharacterized protein YoaH (UPF0181 family)
METRPSCGERIQQVAQELQQLPRDKPVPVSAAALHVMMAVGLPMYSHDRQQSDWEGNNHASGIAALQVAGCLAAAVQVAPEEATPDVMAAIIQCIRIAIGWLAPPGVSLKVEADLGSLLHPEAGSISPGGWMC